mgnify:CR=1 FL=1
MPPTTSNSLHDELTARSGMYRLLARIWLREVDQSLLQQLASAEMRDAFVGAGGALPADDSDETIEELAIDYCQLFLGPKDHLPPFQSVWQSGQFEATDSESMQQFIEVVRYDSSHIPQGTMPDHLGLQLDLMAHLLGSSPGEEVQEVASYFFARHLQWPDGLLERASHLAKTDFYRSAVSLTREFLAAENLALGWDTIQKGEAPAEPHGTNG